MFPLITHQGSGVHSHLCKGPEEALLKSLVPISKSVKLSERLTYGNTDRCIMFIDPCYPAS